MSINNIQVGVTNEGLESIASMISNGTIFTIGYFRITNLGDETFYESKKAYDALDPDAWHLPYTAVDFDTDRPSGIIGPASSSVDLYSLGLCDSEGYITVNTVELADSKTIEINCYIPPAAGATFACNEIMVYTGAGTLADPWRSFVWGIMPSITKLDKFGLNLRILVQF